MSERRKNATDRTNATDASHPLPPSPSSHGGFIPPHGGCEKLFSYPKTQIIYDATARFCDRFISVKSRTHDQMAQAARSGNKNIAEGGRISGTSKEAEIKLTNIARASLEELPGDNQDYLRQHGHKLWDKNSKEALYVRKLGKKDNLSYEDFREFLETRPAETVVDILICLMHQANYLLDQQLRRLEQDFLKEGAHQNRIAPYPWLTANKIRPVPICRQHPSPASHSSHRAHQRPMAVHARRRPPPNWWRTHE